MKKIFTFLFILFAVNTYAQINPNIEALPIVAEGKLLYKSEMASWYGTDLFLENYENKEKIGGYFSYCDKEFIKCIFFLKADKPVVIGTIIFDSSFNVKTAKIDLKEREFSEIESDFYEIRNLAKNLILKDTLFKNYKNTNLNVIPLINGKDKKVYVLTGTSASGVVIFGNDYLITFSENNKVITKKQLHKNIIPIYYNKKEVDGKDEGAVHSHLPETGEFITATDICTLMLYEKFTT